MGEGADLVVGEGADQDPLLGESVPPALLLVLSAHEIPVARLLTNRFVGTRAEVLLLFPSIMKIKKT